MKIINLMCALGVFIGAVTVKADDTKSAAPAFADPSKLTEKAPDSFKTVFTDQRQFHHRSHARTLAERRGPFL